MDAPKNVFTFQAYLSKVIMMKTKLNRNLVQLSVQIRIFFRGEFVEKAGILQRKSTETRGRSSHSSARAGLSVARPGLLVIFGSSSSSVK